jgi:hypothetical protein
MRINFLILLFELAFFGVEYSEYVRKIYIYRMLNWLYRSFELC